MAQHSHSIGTYSKLCQLYVYSGIDMVLTSNFFHNVIYVNIIKNSLIIGQIKKLYVTYTYIT